MKALLLLLITLYVQGCQVQDVSIEDWDFYVKNCKVKIDWPPDEGELECTWRI
jgi:hypothetical protein